MRLFDKDKEREMLEQMPTVLENEFFRLEAKDGRHISSANISLSLHELDNGVSAVVGDFDDALCRTTENIVNLGSIIMAKANDTDLAKESMRAVLEVALKVFDNATAEKEDIDDSTIKMEVRLGCK